MKAYSQTKSQKMLVDSFGRIIDYLRIGVTDRCNLRCRYCMPADGIDFMNRSDILSYEEIIRLSVIFRELGINKVRITGGEPFVRKDMGELLIKLNQIFPSIHMTTNATLIHKHFDILREISPDSINISIDSLDRNRFQMITRRDAFDQVHDNILSSLGLGLHIKLNVVVMKGVNDDEIIDFIEFGSKHGVEVRFIEAMPFNEDDGNKNVFMDIFEIQQKIESVYSDVEVLDSGFRSSSIKFSLGESPTPVSIIPAYSRSLCGSCNRIRLTPKGEILTCLYATEGLELREKLRDNSVLNEHIRDEIIQKVMLKKENGFLEEKDQNSDIFRSMTTIGG